MKNAILHVLGIAGGFLAAVIASILGAVAPIITTFLTIIYNDKLKEF